MKKRKNNMNAIAIAAIAFLVITTAVAGLTIYPQAGGSANYNVIAMAIGSLGQASSTNYRIDAISYEIVGDMESENYVACLGWYCGALRPYYMRLTGTLKYSTGNVVANAPIMMTAYNTALNLEYSTRNTTDSSGNFDVTLPIPDVLVDAGFVIKITVYGKVEAAMNKICIKDSINNKIICS